MTAAKPAPSASLSARRRKTPQDAGVRSPIVHCVALVYSSDGLRRPRRSPATEFGALPSARGNERHAVYLAEGEADRKAFLDVLGSKAERFQWICHAYCLMTNHYHLLVETPNGNLSRGMRQLNGVYTQYQYDCKT